MSEIKCPHCGQLFTVDEDGYAALVRQVRDEEFQRELAAQAERIEQAAEELKEAMLPGLLEKFGVTEELKANDQMEWVRRVNQIRDIIREQILSDLVYA